MNSILQKACFLLIFLLSLKYQFALGQNRIIGGAEIGIEKVPYMLRLEIGKKSVESLSFCGASIIGNEWALTVAHCFMIRHIDYGNIFVVAGTANFSKEHATKTVKRHKVIKVIKHHDFNGFSGNADVLGDIAVLKISPPFTYNQAIQPVKLPEKGQPLKIDCATVAGWGKTWPTNIGGSPTLLYVTVPRIKTAVCKALYLRKRVTLKLGEICYGFNNRTVIHEQCQGDSGGPLVNSDNIEIGIVSWSSDCGTRDFPGVYTDTAYFRDWIKENTGI